MPHGIFYIDRFLKGGKPQFGGQPSSANVARRILQEAGIPAEIKTQRESRAAMVKVAPDKEVEAMRLLEEKGIDLWEEPVVADDSVKFNSSDLISAVPVDETEQRRSPDEEEGYE